MRYFQRKHPDPSGIYRTCVKEKINSETGKSELEEIVIEGRNVFATSKKSEISILEKDTDNIEEVDKSVEVELEDEDEIDED